MFSALRDYLAALFMTVVTALSSLTGTTSPQDSLMPQTSNINPTQEERVASTTSIHSDVSFSTSTSLEAPSTELQKPVVEKEEKAPEKKDASLPKNTIQTLKTEEVIPISTEQGHVSFDEASRKARETLVNIYCDSGHPSVGKVTGSGVIVDPKGIIVTNAHVAQYFLIEHESNNTDCYVRTGSPAEPAYEAELIFISPQWMARHALTFSQFIKGINGDYDYAFLGITKSKTNSPLPAAFPYASFSGDETYIGEPVVAAGYAAEILTEAQIDTSLFPTIAAANVESTTSFLSDKADILTIRGTAAAQGGSSGGGIFATSGKLLGIITLGTREKSTADRTFSAISSNYIRRTYEQEEGRSLTTLFEIAVKNSIAAFDWRIPSLVKPLLQNINTPSFYRIIDCEAEYWVEHCDAPPTP